MNAYRFAALIFIAIGGILILYSWPPSRAALQEDQAQIIRIVSRPATRYNVELQTTDGRVLTCVENALDRWPPRAINRCPIEQFKPLVGQSVKVLHDGAHIYEVESDHEKVLSYAVFRRFQIGMDLMALLMIGIGITAWRRAKD